MSDLNRCFLTGRLTRDPEVRATPSGSYVLTFTVASNERKKNQAGQWEDSPNFIDCTIFGERANSLSKILAKGKQVAIDGRLRYSSWERDGQKRSKLEIVVDDIALPAKGAEASSPSYHLAEASAPSYQVASSEDYYQEDIPF